MSEAFVTLLEAPMGGGKTVTATAFAVDDFFAKIYGIEEPGINGRSYEVKPYNLELVKSLPSERIVKVPDEWKKYSKAKIISNYHLYGIEYIYADIMKTLDFINTPIMKDAKWIVDEGWLAAEARKGMSPLTILITEYAQLMRKLNVELYVLVQHGRFIDWRIRYITKRKILTSYNDRTQTVRLLIQNLQKGTEKIVSYWSPIYWKYFDTNELPPIPEASITRARRWA